MTHPASSKPASLYPTRSAAGALLGQQLAARGYIGCMLLGVTPEGVEIAASAAKAMGAQFDVLVAAFIKLGSNLAPIGAIAEAVPSEMDPDFQPSGALIDKLSSAIEESRARVSRDLILYRTELHHPRFQPPMLAAQHVLRHRYAATSGLRYSRLNLTSMRPRA